MPRWFCQYRNPGHRCQRPLPSSGHLYSSISGGIRILISPRAPARTFGLVALSATIVAVSPGTARAADAVAATRSPGWEVGSVRFEPMGPDAGGLSIAGAGTYRGTIEVRRHGRSLAAVNEVGLEDYLRGIDEVPATWPAAVLQAQAIAARTYAAHVARNDAVAPWREAGADICATDSCQVYRGLDAERRSQGAGWTAAVASTAGKVLLAGNSPIRASYSASTSGPSTMSQNGARDMAAQGRSANEILNAYYGIRPTLAPGRVPVALRVAVSMGSSSVRVSATGPFRVLDGDGAELATAAGGDWNIVTTASGVRVIAPASHQRSLALAIPAIPVDDVAMAPVPAIRWPGRVITAATAPPAGLRLWALTSALLVLAAGAAAVAQGASVTGRGRARAG